MVPLLILWEHGKIHLAASRTDTVQTILALAAKEIGCSPSDIALLSSFKGNELPLTTKFINIFPPGTTQPTLYLKILKPFPVRPSQPSGAASALAASRFLAPGESPTMEMKRVAAEFGDRAVSLTHYEHADSLKPRIEEQSQSSCYAIRISEKIFLTFERISLQDEFRTHRFAFLYGRVKPLTGKVTVHCCFEPKQINTPERVDLDSDIDIPNEIAGLLGMQCVGMAISGPFDAKMPIHPYVIMRAAQYQNQFGEYFATLIVSPSQESRGRVSVEAFQVKDVAMRLEKEKWVVPSPDPMVLKFKEPLFVYGVGRKLDELKGDEVNLLLCAVRVRQKESKIPLHVFPAQAYGPSMLDLRRHLENHQFCPSWYKLFDFNLLVYLATEPVLALNGKSPEERRDAQGNIPKEKVDPKGMMPIIIQAILNKNEVPDAIMEGIEKKVDPNHRG